MRSYPVLLRSLPPHSSLLGIFLPERIVFVRPSLSSLPYWHAFSCHLSSLCRSLAFTSLLLYLSPRALTGSVSIGRVRQTR
jgi:hypothetical protein